jgi:hypothetical protein
MKRRGDDDDKAPVATPGAAAAYIASLTEELAQIAKRNGLIPLGYILDMARLEADQVARATSGQDAGGLDGRVPVSYGSPVSLRPSVRGQAETRQKDPARMTVGD